MAANTRVSTDARVPNIERKVNLINTGGTSSNNQVLRVKINGRSHFVQVRLAADGGYAAVAVQRNEIQKQVPKSRLNPLGVETTRVDRPWVLFTVDKDGKRTYGGKGRTHTPTDPGFTGNLLGDNLPFTGKLETTTEAQALAQAATATINGESVTQAEFENMVFTKASVLGKSAAAKEAQEANRELGTGIDVFVPAISEPSAPAPIPLQVIPHNAEDPPAVTDTEVQPGNNDPNVLESNEVNNPVEAVQEFASEAGDKVKGFLPMIGQFLEDLKLTDAEIEQFAKMFEGGGGDKIENAAYPLDNTYGDIRGQDYVTIDQFIYEPPRRDQIFSKDSISNLTDGNQRRSPLKKFVAQVKLPMPNSIQDSNQIGWGKDVMNNLSAAITSGVMRNPALVGGIGSILGTMVNPGIGQIAALMAAGMAQNGGIDGNMDDVAKAQAIAKKLSSAPGASTFMKTNLGSMMLGAMGVNVSPESLLARGFGVIPNSNLELLFNSPSLRTFEFNWRMSARNEREALQIKRIIRFFKQGMAAKTVNSSAGGRTLYLGTPNVFRLQYRTANRKIIEGVNRIKPCAVTGTAVNYTPDGQWSAYDEGQPVSCTMSINMSELEPVYASDYSEKVIRDQGRLSRDITEIGMGDGDLYSISKEEVGY
jgi:hypothetical protein